MSATTERPAVRAAFIAYAAVFALAVFTYFEHYPIPGFFLLLGDLSRALGLMFAAGSVGRLFLRRLGLWNDDDPAGVFAWAVALGLFPLSLALLAVGVAGGFTPQGVRVVGVLWALLGVGQWAGLARDLRFACRGSGRLPASPPSGLAVFVLGLSLVCAAAPPTYYDSLVYHLALPARYLQEGRVGFVPFNQYAQFPQNMELIFGWFLAMGSDVAAQMFNVFLAALTGFHLWRLGSEKTKRWDLILFMTAPCLILLSTETYVEAPLAFLTLLTVTGVERGLRENRGGWLLAAGLTAGFAAGTKYTAILTPLALTPFILFAPGVRFRDRWKRWFLFGVPAFLVFLPWLVKNYFFTGGNPVFPFLPSLFPAKAVYLHAESARAYFQVLDEYKGSSSLLIDLFQLPLRLFSKAESFGGGFDVTGDLGWALPLLLFPLGLLSRRPGGRFLWIYLALHLVLWGSVRPVLRFLYPVFPLVCLLAGEGVAGFFQALPLWARRVGLGLGALFVISNGVLFYWVERVRDPFPVAVGLVSRSDYLSGKLDYYPAMAFMETGLPSTARVLFVGDQRAYYCPRRHLAPMALLPQPLRQWAEESDSGAALRQKLSGLGFTHLYFNEKEAARLKSYRVLDFSEKGERIFREMLSELSPVYRTPTQAVLALSAP